MLYRVQSTALGRFGNTLLVLPNAQITVLDKNGAIATIYSDAAGEIPIGNPTTADDLGGYDFYLDFDDYYDVLVSLNGNAADDRVYPVDSAFVSSVKSIADSAQADASAALLQNPVFDTIALMALHDGFTDGDKITVWDGDEGFEYDASSTLTPDGALIVDPTGMGSVGRLISKRTQLADFAELDSDTRPHPTGKILTIKGLAGFYKVVTSAPTITTAAGLQLLLIPFGDASFEHFGAIGDGVANDGPALLAACTSRHNITSSYLKTYLTDRTIVLFNGVYDFGNSTVTAIAGVTTYVFDASNRANVQLKNLVVDGGGIAPVGVYAANSNSPRSGIQHVTAKNCTGDGFWFVACQVTRFSHLYGLQNGGYGFRFESCNASVLDMAEANQNRGGGIIVAIGSEGFSSGMKVTNSTIQFNDGDGVYLLNNTTIATIEGNWFEGNNGHDVNINGRGLVKHNTIAGGGKVFDLDAIAYTATDLTGKYAVRISAAGRGVVQHNQLPTAPGFDGAHVRFENTGVSDDWDRIGVVIEPNYNGTSFITTTTSLAVAKSLETIKETPIFYHAVKKLTTPLTTGTWTSILTAKDQSSVEVSFFGADNNGGVQAQGIFKTWTSANVGGRTSTSELGTAPNAFANDTFTSPVYLASHGCKLRWNGNNLEAQVQNVNDDVWLIEVKSYQSSASFKPVWLV